MFSKLSAPPQTFAYTNQAALRSMLPNVFTLMKPKQSEFSILTYFKQCSFQFCHPTGDCQENPRRFLMSSRLLMSLPVPVQYYGGERNSFSGTQTIENESGKPQS